MKKNIQIYFFPFCQEGYWPTVYDAIEEMRKIRNRGHKIDVCESLEDAINIAEMMAMEDETWIVVEIQVEEDGITIQLAQNNDYEPIELAEWERDIINHFRIHAAEER